MAIELAKKLEAEIISADSRQIFREMNIGTAKPSAAELSSIRHHFINTHSVTESYDAASFGEDARKLIYKLMEAHSSVILCGGSGLYIKAVCEGFDDIPEVPEQIRNDLIVQYEKYGIIWLQNKMKELDDAYYRKIDQKNPQRLIRALEVKIATGLSISTFYNQKTALQFPFTTFKIGIEMGRDELYKRIDARMEEMIGSGLFEEAAKLYPMREHNALQTVGYQEIFGFMDKKYDYAEAVRLLKRNSRRYAKRQLTWFKRDPSVRWFHPGQLDDIYRFISGAKSPLG